MLRAGRPRFGWADRPQQPRSRREGNEWVGWGMATGQWDAMQMFARARAVLHADGRLVVSSAASDIDGISRPDTRRDLPQLEAQKFA